MIPAIVLESLFLYGKKDKYFTMYSSCSSDGIFKLHDLEFILEYILQ
jgi:hypothetical protein